MNNVDFECLRFEQLSLKQLYEVLALRMQVFIVEQNCPFQDIDGKDFVAWHCLGYNPKGELVAYTRLFDMNLSFEGFASIGRVATSDKVRGQGVGRYLMEYSIKKCYELFGNQPIKIGAQQYLQDFYGSLGFQSTGEEYLEDGIPHVIMIKAAE